MSNINMTPVRILKVRANFLLSGYRFLGWVIIMFQLQRLYGVEKDRKTIMNS